MGAVYYVIEQRECNSDKGILSDQIIKLSSAHAIKRNSSTLRLVNLKFSSVIIAAIYKDRWQVELFFKAINKILKLKRFQGCLETRCILKFRLL